MAQMLNFTDPCLTQGIKLKKKKNIANYKWQEMKIKLLDLNLYFNKHTSRNTKGSIKFTFILTADQIKFDPYAETRQKSILFYCEGGVRRFFIFFNLCRWQLWIITKTWKGTKKLFNVVLGCFLPSAFWIQSGAVKIKQKYVKFYSSRCFPHRSH